MTLLRPILDAARRNALRYGGAVLVTALTGIASDLFFRLTHTPRLSSIFLAGVLLAASLFGSGPAYLAAGLSFVLYLWLVDPRYQFVFGSPEDFDTLMTFLAVSVLIGLLIGRMRDAQALAQARARATETLLQATQTFSATTDEQAIRHVLNLALALAVRGRAFVRDGLSVAVCPEDSLDAELVSVSVAAERRARGLSPRSFSVGAWMARPLRAGGEHFGVGGWLPLEGPLRADEQQLVEVLVDTGAAAIARTRLAAAKAEADSRARTEDLRNALLSSISHDARTPLAAILASASSLHEFAETFDAATRKDLAATIQEEAMRLDGFVANLLNMSRLEAGALKIEPSPFDVREVISRALARRQSVSPAPFAVSMAPDLPDAMGDAVLFEQALANVLENAQRHGASERPIMVAAAAEAGQLCVEVRDGGPGVPEPELDRIFEKFYRASAAVKLAGTGLGLSITRGLVEAMGGSVTAANRHDPKGLAVTILLKAAA